MRLHTNSLLSRQATLEIADGGTSRGRPNQPAPGGNAGPIVRPTVVPQSAENRPTDRFNSVQKTRLGGNTLPEKLRSGIEDLSGMRTDHIQVHYNSAVPSKLDAYAYALGSEIHLAPGQEHHLPHEAWHVVQQMQGRVRPTRQLDSGVIANDEPALEQEASIMGKHAATLNSE